MILQQGLLHHLRSNFSLPHLQVIAYNQHHLIFTISIVEIRRICNLKRANSDELTTHTVPVCLACPVVFVDSCSGSLLLLEAIRRPTTTPQPKPRDRARDNCTVDLSMPLVPSHIAHAHKERRVTFRAVSRRIQHGLSDGVSTRKSYSSRRTRRSTRKGGLLELLQ